MTFLFRLRSPVKSFVETRGQSKLRACDFPSFAPDRKAFKRESHTNIFLRNSSWLRSRDIARSFSYVFAPHCSRGDISTRNSKVSPAYVIMCQISERPRRKKSLSAWFVQAPALNRIPRD